VFIYTASTVIRALTNTKHCSRNFKNYSVQISLFLYIHFFGLTALTTLEPSTSLTPHQPVPLSLSLNTRPMLRRSTTSPVACEHKNRLLVTTRIPRYCPAVSTWLGSLAIRWTPAVSPCEWLALPRHPLTAWPWKDSIAIRYEKTSSVSARSPSPWDESPRVDCPWVKRSAIGWSPAVLSLRLRKETSRQENSVRKLSRCPLYFGLSHFSNVRLSSRRYPSLAFECSRKLWWSRTRECSISFSQGILQWLSL
jgi:hypothetical protein